MVRKETTVPKVTVSIGKPVVPIVVLNMKETTIHLIRYGGSHLYGGGHTEGTKLVCRKTLVHINKEKAYGRQGKAPTRLNYYSRKHKDAHAQENENFGANI